MTDGDERLSESRAIVGLLLDAAARAKGSFGEAVEQFGLPLVVARALFALAEPTSMKDLAKELRYDPSYMTSIADQLEDAGYIKREQGADRRIKMLVPTAAGITLRAQMAQAVAERSPIVHLTDSQRANLVDILHSILAPDGPNAGTAGG